MSTNPLSILGTGGYTLPVVGNEALLSFLGSSHDSAWLVEKTGIQGHSLNLDCSTGKKRVPEDGWDYALKAARETMDAAGVSAHAIDHLCLSTCTPRNVNFMADALALHSALGLRPTAVIDQVDGGCGGLAKAFQTAEAHARGNPDWTALIIGANDVSSFLTANLDQYRRVPGALLSLEVFSDGAGALVLGPGKDRHALVRTYCAVDGNHTLVKYKGGGTAYPTNADTLDSHVYVMDGRDVMAQFRPAMGRTISNLCYDLKISSDAVSRWYLHQANFRLIQGFAKDQGISMDRIAHNVDSIGNTVNASTLLLLHDDLKNGGLPPSPVVFAVVGAGMMEGGAVFMPPVSQ